MAVLDKPLDDLTEADLQDLVELGVAERKTIEYKQLQPADDADSKKEFLADVSSFANASGGHLIFGMEADDGVPTRLVGINVGSGDKEILRLDNIVRDGIQPRIPTTGQGTYTRAVPLSAGTVAIVMRIPHSWAAPHMVAYRNSSRFFARTSNGKYQLNVGEIRAAFLRSETFADRVRAFRADRLASVVAGETPLILPDTAKLVLHVVPFGAFDAGKRFDLAAPEQRTGLLLSVQPIGAPATSERYNFDGLLRYGDESYVQVFRNGSIEAVDANMLRPRDGRRFIPSVAYERYSKDMLRTYLLLLKQLGVELPLLVMLSLVGVRGYKMGVDPSRYFMPRQEGIDRDALVVPEELVQDFEAETEQVLKPSFDAVWNAAGWPRSMNYDEQGRWIAGYQ